MTYSLTMRTLFVYSWTDCSIEWVEYFVNSLVNKGLKITNLPCNPWLLQMAGLRSQSSKDEEFDFLFRRPSAIRASQFEVRPYTKLEYDQ